MSFLVARFARLTGVADWPNRVMVLATKRRTPFLTCKNGAPPRHVSGDMWAKIVAALKRHGAELLPEGEEHDAGVR